MTLYLYFVFMVLTMLLLQFSAYPALRKISDEAANLMYVSQGTFAITMLLWMVTWFKDPGYLKRDRKMDFGTLLRSIDATSMCPECRCIKTPRSFHCSECNSCVERLDHHCPWVNNCIGKGNYLVFYIYIIFQNTYLLTTSLVLVKGKFIYTALIMFFSLGWIADIRYDVLGTDGF